MLEYAVFTLKQQIGHSVKKAQIVPASEKAPIGFAKEATAPKASSVERLLLKNQQNSP